MKFIVLKPNENEILENSKKFRFHTVNNKECLLCHSKFNYGFEKTKICGLCKLEIICDNCNEKFIYEFSSSGRGYYQDQELIENILNNNTKDIKIYCPSCIKKYNPGICVKCDKFSNKRGVNNIGIDCECSKNFCTVLAKNNQKPGKCLKCNKITEKRNINGLCKECSSNLIKSIINKNKSKGNCSICGIVNEVRDQNGRGVSNCNCSKEAFLDISKIAAYKNSMPGICTRCKKDTNNYKNLNKNRTVFGICCLCQADIAKETGIGNKNFIEKDNILYYYNYKNNNYISWEDYKKKFQNKRITKDLESFINKLISLDIFQPKQMGPIKTYNLDDIIKIYPTFRTQESESWEGAKQAFEQSLIDEDISWFTYIKFYITSGDNKIRPLVVGKSGSKLVNSNGSDVSFSINVEDGPARRFLIENNYEWDKTKILIIKAKSEKQALYYEYYIQKTFELFES